MIFISWGWYGPLIQEENSWILKGVKCIFLMYYRNFQIINKNLLSFNQIIGSCDYQYLWNDTVKVLDFYIEIEIESPREDRI